MDAGGEAKMTMKQMDMAFSWGKNTESQSSYIVELVSVFLLSILVESLSHTRFISSMTSRVGAGLLQTLMYGVRMALAYLVMLAVMSFNVGVLLVAVAGYSVGFFIFGSRVFEKLEYGKPSDLPPLNC
ncbi:copper transporter 1-like [Diospyros lotus]|uniref:copper transporter 1-like n=1 Tax=Diospyros lotus TaxID=55363 RepID=UPI00225948D8|nr:copper transporter 1-like [Diospyros lotus]